jgi:hypothetical protein
VDFQAYAKFTAIVDVAVPIGTSTLVLLDVTINVALSQPASTNSAEADKSSI